MRKTYALIDKYEIIFLVAYLTVMASAIYGAYLISTWL